MDGYLVEETKNLSCHVLASSLLVVHNTSGGGKDNVTELTSWQELDNPLLEIADADVVAGRDDTAFVETAVQLDDNLARSVVVNFLEFTNVTELLHDTQVLDDDLGAWVDEHLTFSRFLCIVDGIERIIEDGSLNHFVGCEEILKSIIRK